MKQIELSYLNAKHQAVIGQYIKEIKQEMYFSTEYVGEGKYQDFLEILNSIYLYSNNFYDTMLKNEDSAVYDEFIFLIPNMIFYTTIGFLTALKDGDNDEDMIEHLKKIALDCENVTSELADILIDTKENRMFIKSKHDFQLSDN
jgi:hypothetical protein